MGLLAALLSVLLAVTALFLWWTYRPPQLPLFTDPVTGQVGRGL